MMNMKRFLLLGTFVFALAGWGQATIQIDDGDTLDVIYDNDWRTHDLWVGVNNSGNGLAISNGAAVFAGDAYFGRTAASTGNFADISENALLSLKGSVFVGEKSSGNTIHVEDWSAVYTDLDGVIGYEAGADNNQVVVTGTNSYWETGGNLFVGYSGSGNGMQVTDEADALVNGSLYLGVTETADNNRFTLSDSDMILGGGLFAGYAGSGNEMRILDGAQIWSVDGFVGLTNGANDNLVMVSGTNAAWTVLSGLYIGTGTNTGNRVVVTNGGSVVVYDTLAIEGTNSFDLEKGGLLMMLSDVDASTAGFNFNEGASLYVGGTLSGMTNAVEDGRVLSLFSEQGRWLLPGSSLTVGAQSSDNTLYVENGAWVKVGSLDVGTGASSTGNLVSVMIEDSLLEVEGSLTLGSVSNAGNMVEVSSGGTIALGGDLVMSGSSNIFNLADGGWLVVGNGLDVAQPGFHFLAGGTLESRGELTGLGGNLEDRRTVLLSGSSAAWNLETNGLYLGSSSSSNALYVLDGAYLSSAEARIGNSATFSNLVQVSGAGSLWENTGDLALDGYYNDLVITDGGHAVVGQTLSVENQSALSFASGGYASASNYYQDASSIFAFQSVTNSPASPALLNVADTAELEGGTALQYTGNISGVERGIVFTNRLIASETLVVGGVTNATGTDLDALQVGGIGSLLRIDLFSEADDLYALISRLYLADSAGFDAGSGMAAVCDEIDALADAGDPLANNMLQAFTSLDTSVQNAQLTQLYDRHAPTYAHMRGMLEGFKQARIRGIVPNPMLPYGAYGPHFYGNQAQGWIKGYGTRGQRDGTADNAGYDQSTYGAMLGFDKSYGDLLTGLAGGVANSEIRQDDGDRSTADTVYGMFFVSWGTHDWFADLNVGLGKSDIEDRSGTMFAPTATYDAGQMAFYLGGGKESIFMDDRLFVTPSAALSGSYYMQEGYTESSGTSVPRVVEDYNYTSLQSELGIKASYMHEYNLSALVPEVHANWMHEFKADRQDVGYSLAGGTGNHTLHMQAPVEDVFEVGTGISWWVASRSQVIYEWSASIDGRFGDGYSEAIGGLRLTTRF